MKTKERRERKKKYFNGDKEMKPFLNRNKREMGKQNLKMECYKRIIIEEDAIKSFQRNKKEFA